MRKSLRFGRRSKALKDNSRTPLIKENNNNIQDGYDQAGDGYDLPCQNTFHEEQCLQNKNPVRSQELAQLLEVVPDAISITSEDGYMCTVQPEPSSGQHNLTLSVVSLIQRSVSEHFPKPPTHPDQNLRQHLLHVQEAVVSELVRLGPLLDPKGLMGCLIDCYHRQTFDHLHSLLQNVTSTHSSFVLMNWATHTYHSKELLGHPELQKMDPIKKVDVLLFKEWSEKAKDKLLENVQTEVRRSLEKILQIETRQGHCDCEEDYVGLYVDIIQCIDAIHKEAQKISSKLSHQVQEICFRELLIFVSRYNTEQTEALGKIANMDKPATIHFLKTLRTCKELKQYVQTKGTGIKTSPLKETVQTLENLEASALDLLMDVVADIAESHLKKYFTSDSRRFLLLSALKEHFPKLRFGLEEQKTVMDEAYKLIVRIYVKRLVKISQSKLKKRWSADVGQTVTEDAELLHNTISDLAPGVQQWNLMLLRVTDILECNSIEALKITVASMQKQFLTKSNDMEFLRTLLRWKGLSKREVTEVLDALPPDFQPRPDPDHQPRSARPWCSCFSCLSC
ncbi:exocyst complex component 3-like protein [Toxotes jaculatrix]|uniref:exocyst complex component 3-like protein n=1 Tax=Toxotes jaculatrix TaxID=941984 RepID=UPI001B3AC63D|nr:exocyst complex component 3-like protein [Toxotes jaculatrix]